MRTKFWGAVFALLIALAGEAAHAQKVVVLEFSGDRKGKLRSQVERALKKSGKVELISLRKYKAAAAKKKLKGPKAMSAQSVAKVAKGLGVDAVVAGSVGANFFVRILDSKGKELWSKDLPLRQGKISTDKARRLAAAVATAAQMGGQPKLREPPPSEETSEEEFAEDDRPVAETPIAKLPVVEESPSENDAAAMRARKQREDLAESHTVTEVVDADLDVERAPKKKVGPRLITFNLIGTTTWRHYCARPGVRSCGEFDKLPEGQRPVGAAVDFIAMAPYAGFGVATELFPMASLSSIIQGFGAQVSYQRGFSLTTVTVDGSSDPQKKVVSVDEAYLIMGIFRWHFGANGTIEPLTGYLGVRGGFAGRNFDVDPTAQVALPGSHRRYPAIGVDAAYPFTSWLRAEAAGTFFLNPKAGENEVEGYGETATGSGFSLEAGLGGDIWGPVGYVLRFKLNSYQDAFEGTGSQWTQVTFGAAQETYAGFYWGLAAHF